MVEGTLGLVGGPYELKRWRGSEGATRLSCSLSRYLLLRDAPASKVTPRGLVRTNLFCANIGWRREALFLADYGRTMRALLAATRSRELLRVFDLRLASVAKVTLQNSLNTKPRNIKKSDSVCRCVMRNNTENMCTGGRRR